MVRNIQTARYDGRVVATEEPATGISYADIARACGFQTTLRIDQESELPQMLKKFLFSSGPSFLEIVTDMEEVVFPVIAQGKGYKDMDMGPYISRRPISEFEPDEP